MRGVSIKRVVKLDLSKDDWELYNSGAAFEVALKLNKEVAEAINGAESALDAMVAGDFVLDKYAEYGAADSEGYAVLRRIVEEVFAAYLGDFS